MRGPESKLQPELCVGVIAQNTVTCKKSRTQCLYCCNKNGLGGVMGSSIEPSKKPTEQAGNA